MYVRVQTPFGALEGSAEGGLRRFLGVPYAAPPLGELRFRAPRPVAPWEGVRRALQYARDPIQNNLVHGPERYSEDCLYLNIWAPEGGEGRPVMLWIPGGAFATGGSGAVNPDGPSMYDCAAIARETGCVVVSVSYRLNVFGFLNLSHLSARFDDHIGMRDILAAMRWVREAIASFGGDPGNVTIFGESAGAGAISALLCIDEAAPYYHKAILQSNCFESFYTPEESAEICRLYLGYAGLDEERVEGLLDLTHRQLLDAAKALDAYVSDHYTGRCSFCPVVDGVFLRDFPTLADFSAMDKPVLVGSNRSEGNFQVAYLWGDVERFAPSLLRRLSDEGRAALLARYPALPSKAAFGELLTDVMYALPKIRFAEHLSRGQSEVYVYRFDYYTPVMEQLGLMACHVAEMLPLFEIAEGPFRQLYVGSEAEVHEIGRRMRQYWGAFARTGSPNADGLVEWKPYTEGARNTLVIDREDRAELDAEAAVREKYTGIDRLLA